MRFVRAAKLCLLCAGLSVLSTGCASLSPRLNVIPSLARHRAESQYQAAWQAEQRGQLEKARELYAALQRKSPNVPEYAQRMGVVCTELQDYVTAGKYFEHARSLAPRDGTLLTDMGYLAYVQKDYKSAEALLTEATHLTPQDTRAVNHLAMSIGYQGRYDESLQQFRRANSETQAQLNVAFIQSQRNEPDAAMASYRRVLSQEPGNKVASTALQQIHAVHQHRPHVMDQVGDQLASIVNLPSPAPLSQNQSWGSSPLPALVSVPGSSADISPVVSTKLAPFNAAVDAPIITPLDTHWTATAVATQPASPPKTAETKFELPTRSEPPEELTAELSAVPTGPALLEEPAAPIAAVVEVAPLPPADDMENVFEGGEPTAEKPMPDANELAGLEWAHDGLNQEQAAVEAGVKTSPTTNNHLQGFCPVALRDERRLATALTEFTVEYQAQTYSFSSAAARDQFTAHPEWYVPAAGGLDIIEVKRGHAVAQGSLHHACWFRHRLHMFSSADNLAAFRAAPRDFATN